ncbi:hypothetical protein AKJ16_DCAP04486 [Drosera capensis]
MVSPPSNPSNLFRLPSPITFAVLLSLSFSSAMSKEEEVIMEVEALRSVYGDDDCTVLSPYPPHIRVHVVPRTAYVTSQQA